MKNGDITMLEGLTEAELLSLRTATYSALASGAGVGSVISSVSTRDLSTTFTVNTTPEMVLQCIRYALQKINPCVYGSDMLHQPRKWVV